MVSVVLAADSSSASANRFTIQTTEWASAGILKVCTAEGPSFFVREDYLGGFFPDGIVPGSVVEDDRASALIFAARAFLAERAAMGYLARSEHSRYLLSLKLGKKGFSAAESAPALDFLAGRRYLDDARFASAWLRSRSIHRTEGRLKLQAGLYTRGVASEIAKDALDDYFSVNDEAENCDRMTEKLIGQGKNGDKLVASLVRRGFSIKQVRISVEKFGKL